MTHFVWYLEKEKSYNIETLSTLWKNYAENMKQKQVPDPFFYFGQEKKPHSMQEIYLKIAYCEKG